MADGNLFDTLKDISETVNEATRTGNYSDLSQSIQSRMTAFTDSRRQTGGGTDAGADADRTGKAAGTYTSRYAEGTATYAKMEELRREREAAGKTRKETKKEAASYFLQTRPDRRRGILRRVIGWIGAANAGWWAIINLIGIVISIADLEISAVVVFLILLAVTGGITYAFVRLAQKGKRLQKLAETYYRYGDIIGTRSYIEVAELAERAGETPEQVCDNLKAMHKEGMLPVMALDRKKTTLMLTRETINQYKAAEKARKEREAAGKEASSEAAVQTSSGQKEKKKDGEALSPEVEKILAEGNDAVREIREINDRIPDTEIMSDKLYRLENIMKRIFREVQKNPSKAGELHRMMDYYLPTTMKLLRAYADLEEGKDTAGENIRHTRQEIADSMDLINNAFEKLLDDLFQEQAWDLSSDLNVMKTMMAQDGLVDGHFAPGSGKAAANEEREKEPVLIKTKKKS